MEREGGNKNSKEVEREGGRNPEGEKTRSQNPHAPSVLLSQTCCEKALVLPPHRSFFYPVSRTFFSLLSVSFPSPFSIICVSLILFSPHALVTHRFCRFMTLSKLPLGMLS